MILYIKERLLTMSLWLCLLAMTGIVPNILFTNLTSSARSQNIYITTQRITQSNTLIIYNEILVFYNFNTDLILKTIYLFQTFLFKISGFNHRCNFRMYVFFCSLIYIFLSNFTYYRRIFI